MIPEKPKPEDFVGRFREIVSDPLNTLIRRHPMAGTTEGDLVVLHNGHRVPVRGEGAYYSDFSDILVINRGVHEPLEEFAFQCVLPRLGPTPTMLELGAYWGHYSMWCLQSRPNANIFLVEPETENLAAGQANFTRNGYEGTFEQAFVGKDNFTVDAFMTRSGLEHLDVLHADIQGAEVEMIEGAAATLTAYRADYVFVSTHSQELHNGVVEGLTQHGYRIDIASDFDHETTSHDGFILACAPHLATLFGNADFLGRKEIIQCDPEAVLDYLNRQFRLRKSSAFSRLFRRLQ